MMMSMMRLPQPNKVLDLNRGGGGGWGVGAWLTFSTSLADILNIGDILNLPGDILNIRGGALNILSGILNIRG